MPIAVGATGPQSRCVASNGSDAAMASMMHCCAAMLALSATSMCADATGAGGSELTIELAGTLTVTGANMPCVSGRSKASTSDPSPTICASMMCGLEVTKVLVCGGAPSQAISK